MIRSVVISARRIHFNVIPRVKILSAETRFGRPNPARWNHAKVGSQGDKVVEALQATVVSDTWDVIGGPSSVRAIDNALIVSTTQAVHEEVQVFLDKLEKALSTSR